MKKCPIIKVYVCRYGKVVIKNPYTNPSHRVEYKTHYLKVPLEEAILNKEIILDIKDVHNKYINSDKILIKSDNEVFYVL